MRKILLIIIAVLMVGGVYGQENIHTLLQRLKQGVDNKSRSKVYLDIGMYYYYSNPDSAEMYLKQGLNEFSAKNYTVGMGLMTLKLGSLAVQHGNLQTGELLLQDAMKLFRKSNYAEGISSALLEMGPLEAMRNKYDKAAELLLEALKIAEEHKLDSKKITAYISLGRVNFYMNNNKKTLEYYYKALELLKSNPDIRSLCNTYNNIGITHGSMGNMDSAGMYIDKALKRSNKSDLVDVYIYSLMNMAIVYQHKKNNATAISYLNEALELARRKKLNAEITRILINIASVIGSGNRINDALDTLNIALPIALEVGDKIMLDDLYTIMAELYEMQGNYKKANEVLKREKQITDSMYSVGKTKEIANLQAMYELEQSNNKLKEMSLTIEADKQRRNVLIAIAASLVAIVVTIGVYLQKTRKLYEIVSKQKEELSETNKVKDKLFSILGHDLRGPVGSIATVIDLLNDKDISEAEKKEMLSMLQTQTQYTMATLDTLLLWGKTQIADNQIHQEKINADVYVQNNLNLLQYELKNKQIQIVNETKENSMVYADKAQFDFVVRNLLTNAVKYSEQGGTITIGVEYSSNEGYTTLMVKDNGVGMSEEQSKHLFRGYGVTTPGTDNEVGTGIGLMLCHEFVTANGGKIWVDSKVGEGTTFYCTFRNV